MSQTTGKAGVVVAPEDTSSMDKLVSDDDEAAAGVAPCLSPSRELPDLHGPGAGDSSF